MKLPSNAISAEDAARMIGIRPMLLRQHMREGKIKGVKIKKYWYCDLDSVKDYINRNGSRKSDKVKFNGETYVSFKLFCEERGIVGNDVLNRIKTIKLNNIHYISEREMRRYDMRFTEHYGRKIISVAAAAERLNRSEYWVKDRIAENKIETVKVENRQLVFVDSLERLEERLHAGEDFLQIPQNGRIRRAEVILNEITHFEED